VTAQQTPGSHESAPQQTILLYGLERVERTARRKPAGGRQHGGDDSSVDLDRSDANFLEHGLPQLSFLYLVGLAEFAERPVELLAQLSKSCRRRRRPCRHHEIQIAGNLVQRRVKDLPEPPPDGVARHRVSHPPADGESKARRTEPVRKSVHREQLAPVSGALPVSPFKLRRVGQSCPLAPRQRSDGQPFPPAPAPGGDDPAPADRAHALAKAVRFSPFSAIRLIGALHKYSSTDTVNSANNPAEYIRSQRGHPAEERPQTKNPQRVQQIYFAKKVLQNTC
jgi:hypothetical protein